MAKGVGLSIRTLRSATIVGDRTGVPVAPSLAW